METILLRTALTPIYVLGEAVFIGFPLHSCILTVRPKLLIGVWIPEVIFLLSLDVRTTANSMDLGSARHLRRHTRFLERDGSASRCRSEDRGYLTA